MHADGTFCANFEGNIEIPIIILTYKTFQTHQKKTQM